VSNRNIAADPDSIFDSGFESCSPGAKLAWDGGGDGVSWADVANWEGNVLPVDGDSITIQALGQNMLVYDSSLGATRIRCLTSNRQLSITGGHLEVTESAVVSPEIFISGGSLTVTGSLQVVR
jgi:hypothetical protein